MKTNSAQQEILLVTGTSFSGDVFRKLTPELRMLIPAYIKENISLNRFTA